MPRTVMIALQSPLLSLFCRLQIKHKKLKEPAPSYGAVVLVGVVVFVVVVVLETESPHNEIHLQLFF